MVDIFITNGTRTPKNAAQVSVKCIYAPEKALAKLVLNIVVLLLWMALTVNTEGLSVTNN